MLDDYGLPGSKVASADLTNHEAPPFPRRPGEADRHGSTGMSTRQEIVESVGLLRSAGASYALLHCNSTYPAPFRDVNLRYMDRLAELGDCIVGHQGMKRGFHVPIAAVAKGEWKSSRNTSPWTGAGRGMTTRSVCFRTNSRRWSARSVISKRRWAPAQTPGITQGEMMNRVNLAKSLVARVAIQVGDEITDDAVVARSPDVVCSPTGEPS